MPSSCLYQLVLPVSKGNNSCTSSSSSLIASLAAVTMSVAALASLAAVTMSATALASFAAVTVSAAALVESIDLPVSVAADWRLELFFLFLLLFS